MKNNENVRTNFVSYIMGKAGNWRNQECNANPEGDLWEKNLWKSQRCMKLVAMVYSKRSAAVHN